MQIKAEYPPNIAEIRKYLVPDEKAVFAFGDVIYNPSGQDLDADLEFHENVHKIQQKNFTSPEIWWTAYLLDSSFRLSQEVEAYAKQYDFIKRHTPAKYYEACLEDFSEALSSPMYQLDISKDQARTLIRKYGI